MSDSFLPSLWSLSNQSLLGSRESALLCNQVGIGAHRLRRVDSCFYTAVSLQNALISGGHNELSPDRYLCFSSPNLHLGKITGFENAVFGVSATVKHCAFTIDRDLAAGFRRDIQPRWSIRALSGVWPAPSWLPHVRPHRPYVRVASQSKSPELGKPRKTD